MEDAKIVDMSSDIFSTHLPDCDALSVVVPWIYGMHQEVFFLTDLLPSVDWFDSLFLSNISIGRNHTEWCQENKVAINQDHRVCTVFL
jgi:hypothetical protein